MSTNLTYRDIPLKDLYADAMRWRFVKKVYTRVQSPKMDGQHSWHFRVIRGLTGDTIDSAVDRAIEKHEAEKDAPINNIVEQDQIP